MKTPILKWSDNLLSHRFSVCLYFSSTQNHHLCLERCCSWEAAEQSVDCPQKWWVERIKTSPMHPSEVSAVWKWLPVISCPSLVKFNGLFSLVNLCSWLGWQWLLKLPWDILWLFDEAWQRPVALVDQWKPPRSISHGNETEAIMEAAWVLWVFPHAKKKGGMSIINVGLFTFEVFLV